MSGAEWQAEFDRYKQIPQFATLNPDMTLDGFKTIFWWEWGHRLLARVVGAAFIIPGLWFWRQGQLKGALGRQVAVATGLLALEPIVGWWMVTSGLSERTEVAQQRLALHLMIAAATFGALIYAAAGLGERPRPGAAAGRGFVISAACSPRGVLPARPRRPGRGPARRPHLQYLAAHGIELHSGRSVQAELAASDAQRPGDGAVRSSHARLCDRRLRARSGRAALRAAPGAPLASRAVVLAAVAMLQVALGVATLLSLVPVELALAHQALALALFGLAIVHLRATEMEQGRE